MHKLYRARIDRKIGGICGGLGHYFHFDSNLIRLIMVFLCIFTGILPLILAYLIACLIIPLEPANFHPPSAKHFYRSKHDRKIAGICGGLSEHLNMDSTVIRLIFVFLCILTGILPLLLVYLVVWIVIPIEK